MQELLTLPHGMQFRASGIYYSFDIFDPDENDISNATPLQSIVLVNFSKPYNDLPYYRTINVSNEKRN